MNIKEIKRTLNIGDAEIGKCLDIKTIHRTTTHPDVNTLKMGL